MDYTLSSPLLYASASVKAALFVRQLKHLVSASEHPLPPSLASYPLVGNFFPLPLNKEYIAYMELSKQLQSDIISLNFLGTTIVILQCTQATTNLLGKRSAIYLDRANLPMAQARAQQEIDTAVGFNRLPNINDRSTLPHIHNLAKEVLRWQPPAPMGVPHACYKDDMYKGYRIPKGTIVFGNAWAITRDASVHKDPESFNPDRFLDPSVPSAPVFGWGRRKCPGSHYAEDFLFVCVASILASFNLNKAKDENGEDIIPSTEGAANTALYHPKPFKFVLAPRSESHQELVRGR